MVPRPNLPVAERIFALRRDAAAWSPGNFYHLPMIPGRKSIKTTAIDWGYVGNTPAPKPPQGRRFDTKKGTPKTV